ncbi:hypothetical protein [Rhodovibrio sodomensis]|nr:hypothetical protein [Rhodovibrio sodomensis]
MAADPTRDWLMEAVRGRDDHDRRIKARECEQRSSIKSNLGVKEELARISAYLEPAPEASSPNARCENHGVPISAANA